MRTSNFCFNISYIQIYNTWLLTSHHAVNNILRTYLIARSKYLLITFTHFPHLLPPALAITNLLFVSSSTYRWDHAAFVFLGLTYFTSLFFFCCILREFLGSVFQLTSSLFDCVPSTIQVIYCFFFVVHYLTFQFLWSLAGILWI